MPSRAKVVVACCCLLIGMEMTTSGQRNTPSVSLTPYVGFWEGTATLRVGYTNYPARVGLSVSADKILLEVTRGVVRLRAVLRPTGVRENAVQLEAIDAESTGAKIDISYLEMALETTARTADRPPLRLTRHEPERTQRRPAFNPFRRRSAPAPTPSPAEAQNTIALTDATVYVPHTAAGQREYGGSGIVAYEDWRTANNRGPERLQEARVEDANARLAADITALQNNGWTCLTQVNRTIPAGGTFTLKFEDPPGGPHLHVIYSRIAVPRLVYSVSTQPPGYLRIYGLEGRNYPAFLSEHGWTSELVLTTQPVPGSLERLPLAVPISVFDFGHTFGDYGQGCKLSEFGLQDVRQFDSYVRLFGKIALSVGLENMRRQAIDSDSAMLQAFATIARNAAVESALRELSPTSSDEAIGYYSRWAVLLLSSDVSTMSVFRETAREYLLQEIRRERPDLAGDLKLLDAVIDLYFQQQLLHNAGPRNAR